jgi:hypothetical protein
MNATAAKITYRCDGDVRGWCGHNHRTIDGAIRCLDRDQCGCESQRGYSDREIVEYQDRARIGIVDTERDYDGHLVVSR